MKGRNMRKADGDEKDACIVTYIANRYAIEVWRVAIRPLVALQTLKPSRLDRIDMTDLVSNIFQMDRLRL